MQKRRHRKKHSSFNQQQKKFIQNWSPFQQKKDYNALQDPHANYYFYNRSVSHHLKGLNSALNTEKNIKQKQKLKSLIKQKIKIKLPQIQKKSPKLSIYFEEGEINRKNSDQTFRKSLQRPRHQKGQSLIEVDNSHQIDKKSRDRPLNKSVNKLKTEQGNIENKEESKNPKTSEEKARNQNIESVHISNHQKFLEFLAHQKQIVLQQPNQSK